MLKETGKQSQIARARNGRDLMFRFFQGRAGRGHASACGGAPSTVHKWRAKKNADTSWEVSASGCLMKRSVAGESGAQPAILEIEASLFQGIAGWHVEARVQCHVGLFDGAGET